MKILNLILLSILLCSCGQSFNSNSNDQATYGNIGISPGSNLYNAYVILQNKCFQCHGDEWKNYKTSQNWIDHGLVVSGSLTNSSLYTSLKNVGGSMPKGSGANLTDSELETIKAFILNP